MAGSVNIDNGNTAASSSFRLNLSKCAQEGTPTGQLPVYTAGVSTVHPGDGQTGCHHLQYISGGAPSAAALAAINMTGNVSGSPSPTSGNRVDWDMCYISENFTEFNDSVQTGDRNGCRLDLTNDGWVLRGDAKGKLRIRCEAFCLKMVFE
jgi:hypothetical protein